MDVQLKNIIRAFDGLIYVCSQDYHIQFMNENLINRIGFDATGELCYRILHNQDSVCSWCTNDRVVSGEITRWEVQSPKDNRWYYAVSAPLYNDDGTISVQSMILDITDHRLAEGLLKESEAKYRSLASTADSMYLVDRDCKYLFMNEGHQSRFGIPLDRILGRSYGEFHSLDDTREFVDITNRVFETSQSFQQEHRSPKDGGYFLRTFSPVKDFDGKTTAVTVVSKNLTDRKLVEEALRESEKKYRDLIESLPQVVFETDQKGKITFFNLQASQTFGYSKEDIKKGLNAIKLIIPEERERLQEEFMMVIKGEKLEGVECTARRKDGSTLPVIVYPRTIICDNKVVGTRGIVVDITDRKRSMEALQQSEKKYRTLVENAYEGICVVQNGIIRYINPRAVEFTGYSLEEFTSHSFTEFVHPDDVQIAIENHAKRMAGDNVPKHYHLRLVTKEGSIIWAEVDGALIEWEGKPAILNFFNDITGRKEAEEERIRLATSIEQTAEGIVITDMDWTIQYVNPAFERMSGYSKSEIIGQHTSILKSDKHDEDFYKSIRDSLTRGEVWSKRIIDRKKNGMFYEVEVIASPVYDDLGKIINYVSIHRDITHEVRLEKELRQAQKMEAIGTLAGGIAHDFNNILMAITGFTGLAHSIVPEGSKAQRYLEQVIKAGSRASDLVRQILSFSRQTEQEKKPLKIVPIVEEVLKLLRSSLPSTIEINQDIEIPPEGGTVLADPTQIHQVLMNLCTNAAHAMHARGGVLSVNISEVEADASLVSRYPNLKSGIYVRITVSDTGHGMDALVMKRIFEPYYTTKKASEGTGMGLAVALSIIKYHGGTITVYSEPLKGSTFQVYLPRIEEEIATNVELVESLPRGSERILFVDDEKVLADLGQEMLEPLGYRVTVETSSLDALETFLTAPTAFDLVITDMTMPALTGAELAKELITIRPDIPIILCTGYSDLIREGQNKETGIREFITKPYVITELAKTIRKVLEHDR